MVAESGFGYRASGAFSCDSAARVKSLSEACPVSLRTDAGAFESPGGSDSLNPTSGYKYYQLALVSWLETAF